jgi:hypothetical protein
MKKSYLRNSCLIVDLDEFVEKNKTAFETG